LGVQPLLVEYTTEQLQAALEADEIVFIDTRHHSLVHEGTVPRSLNIPGVAKAASYAAWAYDPEREHRPLVVLADTADEAGALRDHLVRVGIDEVTGYIPSVDGLALTAPN